MDVVLAPNHLTECARIYVYLSQENTTLYIISCLFCNNDYSDWFKFCKHLRGSHLEKVQLLQPNVESYVNMNESAIEHLDEFQLENLHENQYLNEKTSGPYNNDVYNLKDDSKDSMNEEFLEEYLSEYGENIEMEQLPKPINTCFFRLCTTDSSIMLKFIELLRQHPWQWNHKHNNLTHKNKRLDSTLDLTKQLNEHLQINITPQGTRASVLTLLRWFDREYIRFLNCQKNDFTFVCTHAEYFERLLEFLPYQHLKPMACDECPKHFKSEHLLMAHKHKYHNGQVPFRCRYCGHGFIHQSSHKMHENRHTKLYVWPCKICLYQAASKSDYIKHVATHSSRQPYKCSICGLAYKTKTNLNVHLKNHSLPAYECEVCKKKFYEKYRYKRHIWLHDDQETLDVKSIDNFTCEICGRRFTSNKNLLKHQLVHIQENYEVGGDVNDCNILVDVTAYYCNYCSLEFVQKEAYETHMNLKHSSIVI